MVFTACCSAVVVIRVNERRRADLLQVVETLNRLRALARALEGGQQKRRQNADDGHH